MQEVSSLLCFAITTKAPAITTNATTKIVAKILV